MKNQEYRSIPVGSFKVGKGEPLTLMSGPCVIESEDLCFEVAEKLKAICLERGINYIFKASYDKANRSSISSYRGPGIENGLKILEKIKSQLGVPVVTDVHSPEQATMAGEVCDVIQIPAFLSRQTDLVVAAGMTGKVVSIKKGQFMAPWDMGNVVDKVRSTGNDNIILIDRGASFGYNNLVSDMRAIPIMHGYGVPVCFDATHSVQLPGGQGDSSGGQREFIETLARAAIAAGADCLFMEAHPDPQNAKSDAASQVPIDQLPKILDRIIRIYEAVQAV
ncbi:MAG: 3-deoxy-8-phosphooctulonate synthase [Chlamydiota bacterium]|nr:3-deoxy-8-phosphooctulonate synthase [Chlamydiota bacterium]